jgi:hypothetical protein
VTVAGTIGVFVRGTIGVFVRGTIGVFVAGTPGVFVGVAPGVFVGVAPGVRVGVGVCVGGTPVFVGVGVGVCVGATPVFVGVGVGVSVGATPVFVGVGVGVYVGATPVFVGVGVGVYVGATPVFVGVGVGADTHMLLETRLLSIVTAPFLANTLPSTCASVVRVMLVSARIFPTNAVVVPRVAELPTCQKTLHRSPPLSMATDELLAVVSVLPIWKMKTASGFPSASRTSAPVN